MTTSSARRARVGLCAAAAVIALPLAFASLRGQSAPPRAPYTTWSQPGGSPGALQYSALKQIDKSNVASLELKWFYPAPGPSGRFAFSPLVVDEVMYFVGRERTVVAVDALTGKELWAYETEGNPTNRGFNYWESKDRSDRRLTFTSASYLQQLDARTGQPIRSFGNDGLVNLREGLGRTPTPTGGVQSGSPGQIFENTIVLGSAPGEGYNSPPGDIRAYDVFTGKLLWTFHTIPRPGELGYDTWPPDAWKTAGGANTWAEFGIDEKRGIGYFPLGSPTFDLWGGDRKGDNLFGNTLLALDLRTGKRVWHYQLLHHDIWDFDLVTGPKLLTVKQDGKPVDIVAQATKFGLLYVFDRVTGKPLWPIEERPVPQSDVPGEASSPTQPFPTKPPPFSRLKFSPEDINPYLEPDEKERVLSILKNARNEGIFTPLSLTRDQISIPGELGGANWGGAAGDPETGMLYVRSADQPALHTPLRPVDVNPAIAKMTPQPRYTGRLGSMFFATNGLNTISPPWAQITAYDLNTGTITWQAPLGVVPSLAAKGITNTGNNYRVHRNGPVVTAGGLIFVAHFADRTVRAFDKDTGKVLWEKPMEANFSGIPAVYEVRERQYVAFFGGATERPPTGNIAWEGGKPGAQGYYVFGLPESGSDSRR
jgi:glucose dehydrogenase